MSIDHMWIIRMSINSAASLRFIMNLLFVFKVSVLAADVFRDTSVRRLHPQLDGSVTEQQQVNMVETKHGGKRAGTVDRDSSTL